VLHCFMEQTIKLTGRVTSKPSRTDTLSFYISVKNDGNPYCEAAPNSYDAPSPKLGDNVVLIGNWVRKVGQQGSETVFCFNSLEILPVSSLGIAIPSS